MCNDPSDVINRIRVDTARVFPLETMRQRLLGLCDHYLIFILRLAWTSCIGGAPSACDLLGLVTMRCFYHESLSSSGEKITCRCVDVTQCESVAFRYRSNGRLGKRVTPN